MHYQEDLPNMPYRLLLITLILGLSLNLNLGFGQGLSSDSSVIPEQELVNARAAYIKGLEEFEQGNYQRALELLSDAYIKLPEHAGVNYALADAYLQVGDLSNAAYYGKQATNLDPGNKWYHLKLAGIYRSAGRNQATIEELEQALEYHPHSTDILFELAQTYADHARPMESNQIYNRLLKLTGPDITIHLQKLRNFDDLRLKDSVRTQLQTISALDPHNLSTMQMVSNYYLQMGETQKAKAVLKEALRKNERDPQTLVKLADIYADEAKWDSVGTLLASVISDPIIEPNAKLTVTQYLLSRYQQDPSNAPLEHETQNLIDLFVTEEPDFGRAHALAATFYAGLQNNDKALQALAETNDLMPSNDEAWRQRLQLLILEGQYSEAIEIGKRAAKEIPQDPHILYFWGSAYLAEGNQASAADKLQTASELPARKPLKSAIYSSLGNAYATGKQWQDAFDAYERALELDPKNDVVLNNYAYYLSLQGKDLDKAEAMALKALSIDPESASYLDTAGWVYYKKEDFEKARKYIQAAIKSGNASAEVLEHMGNVWDKLNQHQKAREWWKKAWQKDSSKTYLKQKLIR